MSFFLGFFKHENKKGLWDPPRLIDCLRVWGSVYIKKGRQAGSAVAVGRKLPFVYKVLYDIAEGKARSWSQENGQKRLTMIYAEI